MSKEKRKYLVQGIEIRNRYLEKNRVIQQTKDAIRKSQEKRLERSIAPDQNYLGKIEQINKDVLKTLNGLGLN
jgi:hypothetical protein